MTEQCMNQNRQKKNSRSLGNSTSGGQRLELLSKLKTILACKLWPFFLLYSVLIDKLKLFLIYYILINWKQTAFAALLFIFIIFHINYWSWFLVDFEWKSLNLATHSTTYFRLFTLFTALSLVTLKQWCCAEGKTEYFIKIPFQRYQIR